MQQPDTDADLVERVAVTLVWIRRPGGDLQKVDSLGVPRIGDSVLLDGLRKVVADVTWQHDPCADGSLCLRPIVILDED